MGLKNILPFAFCILSFFCRSQEKELEELYQDFLKGYAALSIPATDLDYMVNFSNIQSGSELKKQEDFFAAVHKRLLKLDSKNLNPESMIRLKLLNYELDENVERIALEKKWNVSSKVIPPGGLHMLENYKAWYSYYVKHFTGVEIRPEEVYAIGESEVKNAQAEIKRIQDKLGYKNEDDFYKDLKGDRFFISSKAEIISLFAKIDSTVRKNLGTVFNPLTVPRIEAMEWPGATASTPPGIYLSKSDNPYNVDVFQFNFSTGRYNRRCMDWLYMHEAIPGHHLQSLMRDRRNEAFYFGTLEGWACYVEDLGREMGLYTDLYSLLGKHEWNLVRSARLVMEVGIHYYGWSFDEALQYWKKNIHGQDEISEREIRRITRWPGQSLCYKIGALRIREIISKKTGTGMTLRDAHGFILEHSQFPLTALL